jgi:tagatose-1,6-bisphosphate aldolase non-catalytic subunit AgaZ/GatZ
LIAKLGPLAFREALFAMAAMEAGLEGIGDSAIVKALDHAMARNPANWRSYVPSGLNERLERLLASAIVSAISGPIGTSPRRRPNSRPGSIRRR